MEPSNNRQSFGELIRGNTPVLVDFTATWCGPCKMMKPILEQVHKRLGEQVKIIKVDIDQSPAAANAYQVQSVPTLILFQQGKILWRNSGVIPAPQLESIIQQQLSTASNAR